MEILKVVKLKNKKHEQTKEACSCAGYEGYCSSLVVDYVRKQEPPIVPLPPRPVIPLPW
jgi:hypothetical protein